MIRFLQFDEIYNRIDDNTADEFKKYHEIKEKSEEILIIKNFSQKYFHYSMIKFINNYWQAQNLIFDQKSKR